MNLVSRQLKLFIMICFTSYGVNTSANSLTAPDSGAVTAQIEDISKKVLVSVHTGFTQISTKNTSTLGIDFGMSVNYAIDQKWAFIGMAHQAFDTANFSSLYSELGAGFSLAYKGQQTLASKKLKINEVSVFQSHSFSPEIILVGALAKQYFFNGSQTVVPMTGIGAFVRYQLPSTQNIVFHITGEIDIIGNGTNSATPIKAILGTSLWF